MEQQITAFAEGLIAFNPIIAYFFFFINSALQILFPPYPGDSVIVLSGYLSSSGILNTPMVLTVTLGSTFLSSILLYTLSFKYSDKILSSKFMNRFFNIKKVYSLENWFKKYGSIAIIINKFLPGIGSLTLISAGVLKLPKGSAYASIALASVIHNLLLFAAGRVAGSNMEFIKLTISKYNRIFFAAAILLALVYAYIKYRNYRRNQNS